MKIAFVMSSLNSGGTENAMCNYINYITEMFPDIKIDVLLLKPEGIFMNRISSSVQIKRIPFTDKEIEMLFCGGFKNTVKYYVKKCKFISLFKVLFRRIVLKKLDYDLVDFNHVADLSINEKYDAVIVYTSHMPILIRYAVECLDARNRYLWVHNDFSTTHYPLEYMRKYVEKFDRIFCVSIQLMKEFIVKFPKLEEKTFLFHNILPSDDIINKSLAESNLFSFDGYKILTIGRLDHQKGYDIAIEVAKNLKDSNINFKWYVIGNGSEKDYIEKLIQKYSLKDNFVLLGTKDNPYPYIRECDLYVQPSRHEGYCTAVVEAKLLNKPIIATEVAGSHEILDDYYNKEIVKINANDIFQAVISFYNNRLSINEQSHMIDMNICGDYNRNEREMTQKLFGNKNE